MIVRIIAYHGGNMPDTITKILIVIDQFDNCVKVKSMYPYENVDYFHAPLKTIRKATPEERKQYYTNLWQKQ
jgi:hypothetical protein